MKKTVRGIKFKDEQKVKDAILRALYKIDEAVFRHELEKLLSHGDKVHVVQNDSGYVTPN